MVLRRACWALVVMLSASSKIIILWRPGGSVTLFMAKDLMVFRTTSMPRASEALSSRTPSLYALPNNWRARAWTEVVYH